MDALSHLARRHKHTIQTTRRFDPSAIYTRQDVQLGRFVDGKRYPDFVHMCCPDEAQRCPVHGELFIHRDIIVIAVDGACPSHGRPEARAAIGVFFQEGSPHNKSYVLENLSIPTNQIAELRAGIAALEEALVITINGMWPDTEENRCPSLIIIKSDSAYLVNAMTDWIFKWRKNGYLNGKASL